MKQPWEWDEDDLLTLIQTGVEESLELDYKGSPSLSNTDGSKNEISKDISAFANSSGGTIIYGIIENKQTRKPEAIDNGVDPKEISREWLEQVTHSRIQRKIDGVRIKQVDLNKASPGRVAYVVYIPQSHRAPHQAYDKKFYKRYEFQSVPMEEYEIRDVSRRQENPDLSIILELSTGILVNFTEGEPFSNQLKLIAKIKNYSPEPAYHSIVYLYIDVSLRVAVPEGASWYQTEKIIPTPSGDERVISLQHNLAVPGIMPIFEGIDFNIGEIYIAFPLQDWGKGKEYLLGWEVKAPKMITRNDFLEIKKDAMDSIVLAKIIQ